MIIHCMTPFSSENNNEIKTVKRFHYHKTILFKTTILDVYTYTYFFYDLLIPIYIYLILSIKLAY